MDDVIGALVLLFILDIILQTIFATIAGVELSDTKAEILAAIRERK